MWRSMCLFSNRVVAFLNHENALEPFRQMQDFFIAGCIDMLCKGEILHTLSLELLILFRIIEAAGQDGHKIV